MDIQKIRSLFPITDTILPATENAKERKLIFMDHGASTHAPTPTLNTFWDVMEHYYSNVHRGEHTLSCIATEMLEHLPQKAANFFGITDIENSGKQVILTTNTTSSIDIASHIFADVEGDYLTTLLEHHSNDLPHRRRGTTHHVGLLEGGTLDYDDLEDKLQKHNIKAVAVTAGSNVTGYMPDINKIARMAHDNGAKVIADVAQRTAHYALDAKTLDHPEHIDYIAGGGHKMYAPFGASYLIGTTEEMDAAPPYIPGGGTVIFVSKDDAVFLKGPARHEPGTPNIGGGIALGAAFDFLTEIGMNDIREHELELLKYTLKGLEGIDDVITYGQIPINQRIGVITFNVGDIPHATLSKELDEIGGIATRNGCFCAHPYLHYLLKLSPEMQNKIRTQQLDMSMPEMPGAVRATIGIYNTKEEMDTFLATVETIRNKYA